MGYGVNAFGTVVLIGTLMVSGSHPNAFVLAPALAVIGFGEGLGSSPLMNTVLTGIPERDTGVASGILETLMQVGYSLGVAVLGLVFFTLLDHSGARTVVAASYTHAFTLTLFCNLALALVALFFVPGLPSRDPADAAAPRNVTATDTA
jgi:MFS family permease